MKDLIDWEDFEKIDMRCGSIIKVSFFPEAKKAAYKLWIDFGEDIGIKKTSAQITELYTPEKLMGMQVLAVVNFPPKQIGPFLSECLLCGFYTSKGVVVITPDQEIDNGSILG